MSASLFYDCYADYETYPSTTKIEGDKTFAEVQKGDILYRLVTVKVNNEYKYDFEELVVVRPWHEARGHYYISCKIGKKPYNINFGSASCGNVREESANSSIVYINCTKIGTNKKSICDVMAKTYEEQIKTLEREKNNTLHNLSSIIELKNKSE